MQESTKSTAIASSMNPLTEIPSNINSKTMVSQDTATMVHKVMKDVERRKSNIVVSGLRARVDVDDSILFNSICEQHLSIGPLNVRCRRIDKTDRSSNGKNLPSRLLVHLGSESLATEILDRARQLRFSTDDDVRLNVYFSRDMTPEESKLASRSAFVVESVKTRLQMQTKRF